MHVNVDGVNIPLVQERGVSDGVYPVAHSVVQCELDVTEDPSLQLIASAFVTLGAVQLFGLHVNVDGEKVPREQFNVETFAVYPELHCVTHFDP